VAGCERRASHAASLAAARAALLALAALLFADTPACAQERPVDLELVFSVDASGSVDSAEYRLQLSGIAAALRDAQVLKAIADGPIGAVAVALVVWGDAILPKDASRWFLISGPGEAEAFAQRLERFGRREYGSTGIGDGIAASIRHLDRNGYSGTRRVVDVSGDGRETPPRMTIDQAQAMARTRGVVVNGLAILNDDPELYAWYRDHVRTGQGAFVVTARDYRDFARAMLRKLIREIREEPPVAALPGGPAPPGRPNHGRRRRLRGGPQRRPQGRGIVPVFFGTS